MGLDVFEVHTGNAHIIVYPEYYFENINQTGGSKSNNAYWISGDGSVDEQGNYLPPIFDAYYLQEGLKRNINRGMYDENGVFNPESANPQPYTQINYVMDGAKIIANPKCAAYVG